MNRDAVAAKASTHPKGILGVTLEHRPTRRRGAGVLSPPPHCQLLNVGSLGRSK